MTHENFIIIYIYIFICKKGSKSIGDTIILIAGSKVYLLLDTYKILLVSILVFHGWRL